MSNLGGYQTITHVIKVLGGPAKALLVVIGGSAVAGGAVYAGGQKAFKALNSSLKKRSAPTIAQGEVFKVQMDSEEPGGLKLRAGSQFRVLEGDGDAILIEVN